MTYDIVGYGGEYFTDYSFVTIGDLINKCEKYPNHLVKFIGTDYSPGSLGSWRGSYDIPSIDYSSDDVFAEDLASRLKESLCDIHFGYKGGEYTYYEDEEFYVAQYGSYEDIKVIGYEITEDTIILLTKRDPY